MIFEKLQITQKLQKPNCEIIIDYCVDSICSQMLSHLVVVKNDDFCLSDFFAFFIGHRHIQAQTQFRIHFGAGSLSSLQNRRIRTAFQAGLAVLPPQGFRSDFVIRSFASQIDGGFIRSVSAFIDQGFPRFHHQLSLTPLGDHPQQSGEVAVNLQVGEFDLLVAHRTFAGEFLLVDAEKCLRVEALQMRTSVSANRDADPGLTQRTEQTEDHFVGHDVVLARAERLQLIQRVGFGPLGQFPDQGVDVGVSDQVDGDQVSLQTGRPIDDERIAAPHCG